LFLGSLRLPIRGGNWDNGTNAGLFALNLNNTRSHVNNNVGFRSALIIARSRESQGIPSSAQTKGTTVLANCEIDVPPHGWFVGKFAERHP